MVLLKMIPSMLKSGGAALVTKAFESVLDEADLPEDEREAIMAPIRELMDDFKNDQASLEELGAILDNLEEGVTQDLVIMRGFELFYINQNPALSAEQKTEARKTVSRYAETIARDKYHFATEHNRSIYAITSTETTDAKGNTCSTVKENLTEEELNQCLSIMKNAADEAGIEDKRFPIDIAAAIEAAIADGRR
jgi:truncated hemoglobin YjbI